MTYPPEAVARQKAEAEFAERIAALDRHTNARLFAIGEAIYNVIADHPMWIGDDGLSLDYLPERQALIGDFVDTAAKVVYVALNLDKPRSAEIDEVHEYANRLLAWAERQRGRSALLPDSDDDTI
jgi:hypothetical protein